MKILKFGGSSVASPERIASVVDILKTYHENGEQVAVVFSAFGGISKLLIEMSELAANADDEWKNKFTAFKRRHLEVVYTLLNGKYLEEATDDVEEGIENLESILQGISLIKEASLRTMDYVQSF
jgi:aspartokinase/homoserine dehydrogenase 1